MSSANQEQDTAMIDQSGVSSNVKDCVVTEELQDVRMMGSGDQMTLETRLQMTPLTQLILVSPEKHKE